MSPVAVATEVTYSYCGFLGCQNLVLPVPGHNWSMCESCYEMGSEWDDSEFCDNCGSVFCGLGIDCETTCHCGEPVRYGYDDNPDHHRGMCAHCDSVRCDAFPGDCGR